MKPDQVPTYLVDSIVAGITGASLYFFFFKFIFINKLLFHVVHLPCRLDTFAKKGGAVSGEVKTI